MPKLLPPGVDLTVKSLSTQGLTAKDIKEVLNKQNIEISLNTISNIRRNVGQRRQELSQNIEISKRTNRRSVRNQELIKKSSENYVQRESKVSKNCFKRIKYKSENNWTHNT